MASYAELNPLPLALRVLASDIRRKEVKHRCNRIENGFGSGGLWCLPR